MRPTILSYNRPHIDALGGIDAYVRLLVDRNYTVSAVIDWRLGRMKELIDSHPHKARWNLDDVCKHLGLPMSGRQARRLFKGSTGMGFRDYAKNRCLVTAAEKLRTTNMPIKAVAAEAGYQSSCHFARSFKVLFHLSPMEFRKMWHQRDLQHDPAVHLEKERPQLIHVSASG